MHFGDIGDRRAGMQEEHRRLRSDDEPAIGPSLVAAMNDCSGTRQPYRQSRHMPGQLRLWRGSGGNMAIATCLPVT